MKKFKEFVNEGKLIIETEFTFDEEVNWEKSIDVSKLWKDFEKGRLDLNSYNKQLAAKLEEKLEEKVKEFKDVISNLKKTNNQQESYTIWNNLYDIADKNLIEIKI